MANTDERISTSEEEGKGGGRRQVSEEDARQADVLKNKANEFFKSKQFEEAISFYSQAIELNPYVAAYFANRSFSHLRMESYGFALADADTALELDRGYVKGYYRRASANMALGKFKRALKDFEAVKKARPKDRDAFNKYSECSKIVHQKAFAQAIAVESTQKSLAETIDVETMSVEEGYSGPRWDEGDLRSEFMEELLQWFKDEKKLHRKYAYKIIIGVYKIFKTQPSLVDITIPESSRFTVCGDIHGQFYDLLNIFSLNGLPSHDNPYLFNGDFVDRGSFSVEVILSLFGFKLLLPDHFFMSRGNHESINMNQMYGFEGEVRTKYSSQMWDLFTEVFNWLPLAHLLEGRVLVMHGGLFSRDEVKLQELREIERNRQPPEEGLMCDLLWSDPQVLPGRGPSKRGVGVQFGPDITEEFCTQNEIDLIIRSHEVKAEGFEWAHSRKCLTVFSAPNYCDQMNNKGAFITLTKDLKHNITTYEAVPHPKAKPMQYASPLFGLLS